MITEQASKYSVTQSNVVFISVFIHVLQRPLLAIRLWSVSPQQTSAAMSSVSQGNWTAPHQTHQVTRTSTGSCCLAINGTDTDNTSTFRAGRSVCVCKCGSDGAGGCCWRRNQNWSECWSSADWSCTRRRRWHNGGPLIWRRSSARGSRSCKRSGTNDNTHKYT